MFSPKLLILNAHGPCAVHPASEEGPTRCVRSDNTLRWPCSAPAQHDRSWRIRTRTGLAGNLRMRGQPAPPHGLHSAPPQQSCVTRRDSATGACSSTPAGISCLYGPSRHVLCDASLPCLQKPEPARMDSALDAAWLHSLCQAAAALLVTALQTARRKFMWTLKASSWNIGSV
jgi:hypothetical protein